MQSILHMKTHAFFPTLENKYIIYKNIRFVHLKCYENIYSLMYSIKFDCSANGLDYVIAQSIIIGLV